MENENMNTMQSEENAGICNCENEEVVTPYEADDMEIAEETRKEQFARKCREVKDACRNTADRLVSDWKETEGNPYVKYTKINRVEIFRSSEDETPVDTFESQSEAKGYARALLIAGAVSVIVACSAKYLIKAWIKHR